MQSLTRLNRFFWTLTLKPPTVDLHNPAETRAQAEHMIHLFLRSQVLLFKKMYSLTGRLAIHVLQNITPMHLSFFIHSSI